MRTATISLLAAAMASTVSAHTTIFSVWVNGVDQGDGRSDYIRSPPNNNPVKDLSSPDLVCNVNGATAVPSFVSAAAGDTLSLEWYHNTRGDDIIDGSHKGPINTYIAQYTEGDGTGAIWSKISEDGYDGTSWAVDKLIANKGLNDVVLPADLAAGKYILRQEIIALHEADAAYNVNPARGAQFYPSCIQLEVTGSGSAVPDEAFDFNVGYTYADPGIVFNLYGSFSSYPIPGPEIWTASSDGSDPVATTEPASKPTTTAVIVQPTTTASVPATTLATVTKPATTDSAPTTTASATTSVVIVPDTPAPTTTSEPSPPTGCARKRSARGKKSRKAKRAARLTGDVLPRRVGRAQL